MDQLLCLESTNDKEMKKVYHGTMHLLVVLDKCIQNSSFYSVLFHFVAIYIYFLSVLFASYTSNIPPAQNNIGLWLLHIFANISLKYLNVFNTTNERHGWTQYSTQNSKGNKHSLAFFFLTIEKILKTVEYL